MTQPIAPHPSAAKADATHERTAQEFEAVFAGQLAQLMLDQVEVDPAFGGGHGEEQFRGILAEQLGRSIAQTGALGLAPAVLAQIQRFEDGAR